MAYLRVVLWSRCYFCFTCSKCHCCVQMIFSWKTPLRRWFDCFRILTWIRVCSAAHGGLQRNRLNQVFWHWTSKTCKAAELRVAALHGSVPSSVHLSAPRLFIIYICRRRVDKVLPADQRQTEDKMRYKKASVDFHFCKKPRSSCHPLESPLFSGSVSFLLKYNSHRLFDVCGCFFSPSLTLLPASR